MKVILLRDVARLGKRHAVVEVPDGFALNKLIPQKMAQPATPENLKRVQAKANEVAAHALHDTEVLKSSVAALTTQPLILKAVANAQGSLFKTFKASDISEAAKARGLTLPVEVIVVAEPLKNTGKHDIAIKGLGVSTTISITIEAQ